VRKGSILAETVENRETELVGTDHVGRRGSDRPPAIFLIGPVFDWPAENEEI
jgi:hypothetical protein